MKRLFGRPEAITAVLLIVAFAIAAKSSPYFLDSAYLLKSSTLYVETGLLVLGMTFVIVSGNIDLSVAANLTLSACLCAKMAEAGLPPLLCAVLTPLFGALLGLFNGLVIVKSRLPSFVVTLGTMAIFRGVAQIQLGPGSLALPEALKGIDLWKVGPLPVSLVGLLGVAILVALVLHRTVLGRWVVSCGANPEAARYAGLPVGGTTILVFGLSGLMAGLAGLHIGSRLGYARFDHATGLELDAITAVVLGGASIFGGKGTVLGSMLALLLMAILRIGMGVANVKSEYQLAIVGTLLVATVAAQNGFGRKAKAARQ